MVHFPEFAPPPYGFRRRCPEFTRDGFPHSEISGSQAACASPELIAACHVLHRLLAPRHPPYALSSLTIKFTRRITVSRLSPVRYTLRAVKGATSASLGLPNIQLSKISSQSQPAAYEARAVAGPLPDENLAALDTEHGQAMPSTQCRKARVVVLIPRTDRVPATLAQRTAPAAPVPVSYPSISAGNL